MKKLLSVLIILLIANTANAKVISNEKIDNASEYLRKKTILPSLHIWYKYPKLILRLHLS